MPTLPVGSAQGRSLEFDIDGLDPTVQYHSRVRQHESSRAYARRHRTSLAAAGKVTFEARTELRASSGRLVLHIAAIVREVHA